MTVTVAPYTPPPVCKGDGDGTICWFFCNGRHICDLGEGDCNHNDHCRGDLICGKDNCRDFHPEALGGMDCCTTPSECST